MTTRRRLVRTAIAGAGIAVMLATGASSGHSAAGATVGAVRAGGAVAADRAVVPAPTTPNGGTVPRPSTTVAPENRAALDGLVTARRRWKLRSPRSYRFAVHITCFCPERPDPVVTVRRGVVTSKSDNDNLNRTVPDWFTWIETTAVRAASVRVVYDPTDGHPRTIAVDYSLAAADDEATYAFLRFRRLN